MAASWKSLPKRSRPPVAPCGARIVDRKRGRLKSWCWHQLNVLRRKPPKRVALSRIDQLLLVGFYRLAFGVLDALRLYGRRRRCAGMCPGGGPAHQTGARPIDALHIGARHEPGASAAMDVGRHRSGACQSWGGGRFRYPRAICHQVPAAFCLLLRGPAIIKVFFQRSGEEPIDIEALMG